MSITVKKSESWTNQKVKIKGLGGGFKVFLSASYVPTTKKYFGLGVISDPENKLFLYSGVEEIQGFDFVPYGFVWSETKNKWTKKVFGPTEDTIYGRAVSMMTPTQTGGIMLIGGGIFKTGSLSYSNETFVLNPGLNSWQPSVQLPTSDQPFLLGSLTATSAYPNAPGSDNIYFYSSYKWLGESTYPALHNKLYLWDETNGWEEASTSPSIEPSSSNNLSFFSLGVREDSGNKIALLYTGSLAEGSGHEGSAIYKWVKAPTDDGIWSKVSGFDGPLEQNIPDFPVNLSTLTWQKDYNRWISVLSPLAFNGNIGLVWASYNDGETWSSHQYPNSIIADNPVLQNISGESTIFESQIKPDPWENTFYCAAATLYGPAILRIDVPLIPENSTIQPIYLPELPPKGNNTFCPIWDPYDIIGSLNVSALIEDGPPVSIRGEINENSTKLYGTNGPFANFIVVIGQDTGQVYTIEMILDEDSVDPPSESSTNGSNPYIYTLGGPCFTSNSLNQYVTTLSQSAKYMQEYTSEGLNSYLKCFLQDFNNTGPVYFKLNIYKGSLQAASQ